MFKKFKNIIFVGTSHISKDSVNLVETTIKKERPNIVALELDRFRFHALTTKKQKISSVKTIKIVGFKGYAFGSMGSWIEKKLGKSTGSSPGSEMKRALLLAKKNKIQIALIDQDIRVTLKNISKKITFKEKIKFIIELIKSFFIKNNIKNFNIGKVPENKKIQELTTTLNKEFPTLHKILIIDRDLYMSKALYKISKDNTNKKIVAIVGAGHINGILKILKKQKWPKKKQIGKK